MGSDVLLCEESEIKILMGKRYQILSENSGLPKFITPGIAFPNTA